MYHEWVIVATALTVLTLGTDVKAAVDGRPVVKHVVHSANTSGICGHGGLVTAERRLLHCLLDDYDPAVRPVSQANHVVNVSLNFVLVKIIELHEKDEVMDLNAWMHKTWKDSQLTWDPALYDNVKEIRIPSSRIWKPDIVLYNSADPNFEYVEDKLTVVQHDGVVTWVPNVRLRAYCTFNMRMFPFDSQICQLVFGSWTYDMSKVNLTTPRNASRKHVYEGHEWEVNKYHVRRSVVSYNPSEYPVLTWTIGLTRKGAFYKNILVAPCVVTAILLSFVFLLPPESGERTQLSMGILICQTLLLLLLESYVPTEIAELPIIAVHLLFQMIMTGLSIVVSIGVLNCHYRGVRRGKVPNWLRQIVVGKLSRIFCLKAEPYTSIPSDLSHMDSGDSEMRGAYELGFDSPGGKTSMEKTLEDIRHYVKLCSARVVEPQPSFPSHRELVINEWHQVALVVDRLMFVTFTVVTAVVTVTILGHSLNR